MGYKFKYGQESCGSCDHLNREYYVPKCRKYNEHVMLLKAPWDDFLPVRMQQCVDDEAKSLNEKPETL